LGKAKVLDIIKDFCVIMALNMKKGWLKWLPVLSFLSIIFFLFSLGYMINFETGSTVVALAVGVIGSVSFFEDQFNEARHFWEYEILPQTHLVFVSLAIISGLGILYFFGKNYKIIRIKE